MDEARLQEMWDHHEIRQLLATYVHGCDRADEFEMASVYCEDSWDDHGNHKMQGRDFAQVCVEEMLETTHLVSHQLGQSLIDVNGDEASVETYFIASLLYPPGPDGVQTLDQLGGRYVDTLERVDGKWLIKKRLCLREWSISHPIERDFLQGGEDFIQTTRGQEDVSYAAFGRVHEGKLIRSVAQPA